MTEDVMGSKLQRTVQRFLGLAALAALAFVVGSFFAASTLGPTLTIPNQFVAHTVAQAGQVNQNFQAVRDVVNGLDDANIQDGGITGSLKLADTSVSLAKMAAASVGTNQYVNYSINSIALASNAVIMRTIAPASVPADRLYIQGSIPSNNRGVLIYDNTNSKLAFRDFQVTSSSKASCNLASAATTYWAALDGGTCSSTPSDTGGYLSPATAAAAPVGLYVNSLNCWTNGVQTALHGWRVTLTKNEVAQAVTCDIYNTGQQSCADTAHSVYFSAQTASGLGDYWQLKWEPLGGGGAAGGTIWCHCAVGFGSVTN